MKLDIMGTEYDVSFQGTENAELIDADGICKVFDKKMAIRHINLIGGDSSDAKKYRQDHVIRHELIHAIAEECGTQYGTNEALVDWIAHIIPIVNSCFNTIKSELANRAGE